MLLKIKKSGQALLPTRYTCTTAKESGADNIIARQGVHKAIILHATNAALNEDNLFI
jgi:hypothetical protein